MDKYRINIPYSRPIKETPEQKTRQLKGVSKKKADLLMKGAHANKQGGSIPPIQITSPIVSNDDIEYEFINAFDDFININNGPSKEQDKKH